MARVNFEGQVHEFPDDFTDADISAALASVPAAAPAAPSAPAPVSGPVPEPDVPLAPAGDTIPRPAKIASQAGGRGLIDLLMTQADMMPRGVNMGLEGVDKLSQAVGGPAISYRQPIPSEQTKDMFTRAAEAVGYKPTTPETFPEKAIDNVTYFGTQAAAGGAAAARAAASRVPSMLAPGAKPSMIDNFIRPYIEAPVKTVIGDTVAGAGAGSTLTASQAIPEDIRSKGGGSVGMMSDLIAMLAGGTTAGGLYGAATGAPNKIKQIATGSRPVTDIPLDPETHLPTSNKTADQVAKYVQGEAIDPAKAAANIEANAASYASDGLPIPTTGPLADDVGMLALERGQRAKLSTAPLLKDATPEAKAQHSFGARDTALRDAAVENVNALRPEGARPEAFPERAAQVADARRAVAQQGVDQAAGRVRGVETARRGPAEELNANQMQGDAASANIDETYRNTRTTERNRSTALYNDPALTGAVVPEARLQNLADDLHATEHPQAPLTEVVRKYVDRFRTQDVNPDGPPPEPRPPLTMREVNANRAEVEADIQANLANGNTVRQLRDIKAQLAGYTDDLANEGNDAARNATQNYAERVRPNFREGAGGRMDAKLKSDPLGQSTQPSETAKTFLTRPEDTADLMRIARLGGTEAATAGNARSWLFDRLAQTGVARDGAIDPEKLTRWRNANSGVLDNVPGLRAEVDQMVAQARRGEDTATRYAGELTAAQQRAAATESAIAKGPLGQAAGASPEKAVASIFTSRNPQEAARELKNTVGRNAEADAGMRAAVADHFSARVSNVTPGKVTEGDQGIGYAKLVKEFNKNEKVLAEIYSPEEMNLLRRAHKALEPLAKQNAAQATTGSITAESSKALDRMVEIGFKTVYGGLSGGNKYRNFKLAAKTLVQDTGEADAQRLLSRMMFDPELAKLLLTREVAAPGSPAWNSQLQKYIRRIHVGKEAAAQDDEE